MQAHIRNALNQTLMGSLAIVRNYLKGKHASRQQNLALLHVAPLVELLPIFPDTWIAQPK